MTALASTTPPTPNKGQSSSESFKITMEHFKPKNTEEVIKAVQDGYRDDAELNLPPAGQSRSEENIHQSGSMSGNSTPMLKKYEKVEQQLQQEQTQINPEDLKRLSMEQIRAKVTDAGSIGEDADFGKASRSGSEYQMKELNKLVMMLPVAQSYMEAEKKLLDEKDKSKKSDGKGEKNITTKSPTPTKIPHSSDRAKMPPSLEKVNR